MTKTVHNYILALVCVALIAICCIGGLGIAFADQAQQQGDPSLASDNVGISHLINPTGIATVDNRLYVADNVDQSQTVILCFDITLDQPKYMHTYKMAGCVTELSAGENCIYAVTSGGATTLNIDGATGNLTPGQSYAMQNIVDFASGAMDDGTTVYALTDDTIMRYRDDKFGNLNAPGSVWEHTKSIVAHDQYVYILFGDSLMRYDGQRREYDYAFCTDGIMTLTSGTRGLFTFTGEDRDANLGVYFNNALYRIEIYAGSPQLIQLPLNNNSDQATNVRNVASGNERLYVINDKNKIEIYSKQENTYQLCATIGSEVVGYTVPTTYTGFTLVKPTGYPTNIIYKTTQTNSVAELLPAYNGSYIVLDYVGCEQSDYYYVLIDEQFGWVKKSDGAEGPKADKGLQVVSTAIAPDVTYTAKFVSLETVFIHQLPLAESAIIDSWKQTATTMQKATLLQKFEETKTDGSTKTWYYVSYARDGATKFGFVEMGAVGMFHAKPVEESIAVIGDGKINSSLFEAVTLYLTSALDPNQTVVDEQGKVVKLYSGDRVTVIRQEGEASFIQVLHNDGTADFGWIERDKLMGLHDISTNVIVGLSFLGVALILSFIMMAIFRENKNKPKKRKKKKEKFTI